MCANTCTPSTHFCGFLFIPGEINASSTFLSVYGFLFFWLSMTDHEKIKMPDWPNAPQRTDKLQKFQHNEHSTDTRKKTALLDKQKFGFPIFVCLCEATCFITCYFLSSFFFYQKAFFFVGVVVRRKLARDIIW